MKMFRHLVRIKPNQLQLCIYTKEALYILQEDDQNKIIWFQQAKLCNYNLKLLVLLIFSRGIAWRFLNAEVIIIKCLADKHRWSWFVTPHTVTDQIKSRLRYKGH